MPDAGGHESGFIEDDEAEPGTAQVVGHLGGADGDGSAFSQRNAAFALADGDAFQVLDGVDQLGPDFFVGSSIVGDDPPAALVMQVGGSEDFDETDL